MVAQAYNHGPLEVEAGGSQAQDQTHHIVMPEEGEHGYMKLWLGRGLSGEDTSSQF